MKVSVSILSLKEKNRLRELEDCHPDFIHIDVMDGEFVDNKSYPYEVVKDMVDDYAYDVHLMVKDVKKYIDDFIKKYDLFKYIERYKIKFIH